MSDATRQRPITDPDGSVGDAVNEATEQADRQLRMIVDKVAEGYDAVDHIETIERRVRERLAPEEADDGE